MQGLQPCTTTLASTDDLNIITGLCTICSIVAKIAWVYIYITPPSGYLQKLLWFAHKPTGSGYLSIQRCGFVGVSTKNIIQTYWNTSICNLLSGLFRFCWRNFIFQMSKGENENVCFWLKIGSLKTFHWPLPNLWRQRKVSIQFDVNMTPPKHVHVGNFKHKILKITCYLCTWMYTDQRILWVIKEWMALIDDIKPVYTLEV